jgi:two-component system, LytTR family, response regulator
MQKKYTCVVIDDELNSRQALVKKIQLACPSLDVIAECANGSEGITAILSNKPDIVFLDIEMPDMTGLQMIKSLTNRSFQLIFTTAFNQYALDAIKLSALSYLLKPISIEELVEAVSMAQTNIEKQVNVVQIEALMHMMQHREKSNQLLALSVASGIEIINVNEISHMVANGNYTFIHTIDKKQILATKTLKDFDDILPKDQFIRIHNGSLIQLKYIKKYIRSEGAQVEMQDGTKLDVARRRKEELIEMIDQMMLRV